MGFDTAAPPADRELGLRRARAAALLTLALPGSAYLYQGEELGLPEVEDLPEEALQDPTWERSGRTVRGRDGCRVPLPWDGDRPPFGFSDDGVQPWLPQPPAWAASDRRRAAERSGLDAVAVPHRAAPAAGASGRRAAALDRRRREVLAFDRGPAFRCVVNLSAEPLEVAGHGRLLLASGP